eukprot:14572977-Alexandrium_andersonii.AAC.1
MSASLVGSEMCIRDSHNDGEAIISEGVRARVPVAVVRTAGLCMYVQRELCLLYTSDAADDM